jgi:hypothetical protein
MNPFDEAWLIVKQQERSFIVENIQWDYPPEDSKGGPMVYSLPTPDDYELPTVMAVTAKELDIDENAGPNEIAPLLSEWISAQTGWTHHGYGWYEVSPEGVQIER